MGIRLYSRDIDALARGAMFVSSDGGGPTHLASLLAKETLGLKGYVDLVSPDDFAGRLALVGLIGAPEIDDEKLPTGDDLVQAVGHLARLTGQFDAIGSSEIGGSNALFAVVVAARLGLPLVDVDAMGRSFPTITQSTMFLKELGGQQFVVFADAMERFAAIPAGDKRFVETMATAMNRSFGGVSGMAIGPVLLPSQIDMLVLGTYTRTLHIGRILLETERINEIFKRLRGAAGCFFCCVGKVVRLMVDEGHAPVRRVCLVESKQASSEGYVRIDYQDEYLLVSHDGASIAQTPETITVLDLHTRQPLLPGELAYGQEVAIFAMTASDIWQDPNHRRYVNAQAFGYGDLVEM